MNATLKNAPIDIQSQIFNRKGDFSDLFLGDLEFPKSVMAIALSTTGDFSSFLVSTGIRFRFVISIKRSM